MTLSHAQIRLAKCKVSFDERGGYLAEGFTERYAVTKDGERFSYWYKATGSVKPKEPLRMIGPKTVDNEVTL